MKLDRRAEAPRRRRLLPDEEQQLLAVAGTHLHAVIVAALETGARQGELLALQWRDVEVRIGPKGERNVTARLAAVLAMRETGTDGKLAKPTAYVFGNEVGEQVRSVRTA